MIEKRSYHHHILTKISPLIVLLLVVFAAVAKAEPVYRVGVIVPLSGEHVSTCEGIRNGIQLALEELSDADKSLIEVTFEDDQFIPKNTASAFKKLLHKNNIDFVINASAPTGHAIAPLAEHNKVTFLSVSADKRLAEDYKFTFMFWVPGERIAEKAIETMYAEKVNNIARITGMNEGRYYLNKVFDEQSKGRIKVLLDEDYTLESRDFRSFITKVKGRKDIDAVAVNLYFGQVGLFAKQAKELKLEVPVYGFEMINDPNEIISAQGALRGVTYFTDFSGSAKFYKRYTKTFPGASTFAAANGYELIRLIVKIAKDKVTRENIPEYIRAMKPWDSSLGKVTLRSDDRFDLPAAAKVVG